MTFRSGGGLQTTGVRGGGGGRGGGRGRCVAVGGAATSHIGPFYCPADNGVCIDPGCFDQVLAGQLGGVHSGPAHMYVLAHKFGHHIQTMLGDIQRAHQDPAGPDSGAVRVELQADCYAGLWSHGSSEMRRDWLLTGYHHGSVDASDTFEAQL